MKLTVHIAYKTGLMAAWVGGSRAASGTGPGDSIIEAGSDRYYVTVTNASKERDIVVTHVWFDTTPRRDILDRELPVRLKYSQPWETSIRVSEVPAEPDAAMWLARCLLAPDDTVVRSIPRENVPPEGISPRKHGASS